ncbi:hypothetical protein BT96DRAFT_947302 [Gymnopus androsaceus JB14]|uniref:Uncharacterized protein n=1 Tax=Gymnopus androsaceus JB14 TaxID=1447944 RepID=A0A6A4GSX1_9AGAR|nr:hypothetical protein BT96DRAFT_947302 [Gymnopus androsaceus JB14]
MLEQRGPRGSKFYSKKCGLQDDKPMEEFKIRKHATCKCTELKTASDVEKHTSYKGTELNTASDVEKYADDKDTELKTASDVECRGCGGSETREKTLQLSGRSQNVTTVTSHFFSCFRTTTLVRSTVQVLHSFQRSDNDEKEEFERETDIEDRLDWGMDNSEEELPKVQHNSGNSGSERRSRSSSFRVLRMFPTVSASSGRRVKQRFGTFSTFGVTSSVQVVYGKRKTKSRKKPKNSSNANKFYDYRSYSDPKSRHSRPRSSDLRPEKKARLHESPSILQSNQSSSSNNTGLESLFQELHAAYDWSDEEDDPDPHPNKATPQQRAMVRKGLNNWARSKGFESKSARRNCKRKERKARQDLTGFPPVPPAFPTAPPAPPDVHFTAPPASPEPFADTSYISCTSYCTSSPEEHLDELGLPPIDYLDDDDMYNLNHVPEMNHLDGGPNDHTIEQDHIYNLFTPLSANQTITEGEAFSLLDSSCGVDSTDVNPMEQFVQEISYTLPIHEDPYLRLKYNNPNQNVYYQIASMMYASEPPPKPEPSSAEDEPEDGSEHSWDADEESLDGEWAEMSKQFSLHGQALEEVAQYKIYFVRCERGRAQAIIEHLRRDIEMGNDLIRAAFRSQYPGGIYIQTSGMSPENHILAGYLRTIPGFFYQNARSILPKYYLAKGVFLNTPRPMPDRFKEPLPGRWALIKNGLYRQDVGLVVTDTFKEARSSERIIMLVPRLKLPSVEQSNLKKAAKNRTRQHRPKTPLKSSSPHAIAQRFGVKVKLICKHKSCSKREPDECPHSDKRYRLFGQVIDATSGFVVLKKSIHDIEEAVIISDHDLALFKERLDDLWKDAYNPPRPHSWSLVASERVEVNGFSGTADGALGEIVSTEPKACIVRLEVEDAEHSVPYHYLRKVLRVGDVVGVPKNIPGLRQLNQNLIAESGLAHTEVEHVQVPDEGFVIAVTKDTVDVYLEELELSLTLHRNSVRFITVANTASYPSQMSLLPKALPSPVKWRDCFGVINESALEVISRMTHHVDYGTGLYTGQTPYEGLEVILQGTHQKRGTRMTVKGMRADPKFKSGLGVTLQTRMVQSVVSADAEYDYNDIRRADNHRFLHDLTQPPGMNEPIRGVSTNSYFTFKLGYVPTYTLREKMEFRIIPSPVVPQAPIHSLPPPLPSHEQSPLSSTDGIPGSTPAWTREEQAELRAGIDTWNPSSPAYWFANPELRKSIAGLDVKIATVSSGDQRAEICTVDGVIVVKEVSMVSNRRQYGRILDPSEISTERCTWDVGYRQNAAHAYVDFDFVVRAITLTKDSSLHGGNTMIEALDPYVAAVFDVDRKDLLVIAITGKQQKQGRDLITIYFLERMWNVFNALPWNRLAAHRIQVACLPEHVTFFNLFETPTFGHYGTREEDTSKHCKRTTRSNPRPTLMLTLSQAKKSQEIQLARKHRKAEKQKKVDGEELAEEEDSASRPPSPEKKSLTSEQKHKSASPTIVTPPLAKCTRLVPYVSISTPTHRRKSGQPLRPVATSPVKPTGLPTRVVDPPVSPKPADLHAALAASGPHLTLVEKVLLEAHTADPEIEERCDVDRSEEWDLVNNANIFDASAAENVQNEWDSSIVEQCKQSIGDPVDDHVNKFDARVIVYHKSLDWYQPARQKAIVQWSRIAEEGRLNEDCKSEKKVDHRLYQSAWRVDNAAALAIHDQLLEHFQNLADRYKGSPPPLHSSVGLPRFLARKVSLVEYNAVREEAHVAYKRVVDQRVKADAVGEPRVDLPAKNGAPPVEDEDTGVGEGHLGKALDFSDDDDDSGELDEEECMWHREQDHHSMLRAARLNPRLAEYVGLELERRMLKSCQELEPNLDPKTFNARQYLNRVYREQYDELRKGARGHWDDIESAEVRYDAAEDKELSEGCVGNPLQVQAAVQRLGITFRTLAQQHFDHEIAEEDIPSEHNLDFRVWALMYSFNDYCKARQRFSNTLQDLMTERALKIECERIKTLSRDVNKRNLAEKAFEVDKEAHKSISDRVDCPEKPDELQERVRQERLINWTPAEPAKAKVKAAELGKEQLKPLVSYDSSPVKGPPDCGEDKAGTGSEHERDKEDKRSPVRKSPKKKRNKLAKDFAMDDESIPRKRKREEEGGSKAGSGCLGKAVKAELIAAEAEFKRAVEDIAKKHGKDVEVCFGYLEEEGEPKATRGINIWNAFKAYCAENGTRKKGKNETLVDYNKYLRKLYHKTLAERLPNKEDLHDPEKRKHAMEKEVDWYKGMLAQYIQSAEANGKIKSSVKKMLKPARRIYETSGQHLLGFLLNTRRDQSGRSLSAFWTGTDDGRMLKQRYGTKIDSQVHDLQAMLSAQELEVRGVDAEFLKVWSDVSKVGRGQNSDWKRSALGRIFRFMVEETFGDDVKGPITLNNFLDIAWQSQICITNWPAKEFPKYNTSDQKHMSMAATWAALEPRWRELERDYNTHVGRKDRKESGRLTGSIYQLGWWDEDDKNLTWEDRANIALVTDNLGNVLVYVRDVASWVDACKDERLATMNRGRPRDVVEHRKRRGLPRQKSEELEVHSDQETPSPMDHLPRDRRRKEAQEGAKQKKKKHKDRTETVELSIASERGQKRKQKDSSDTTQKAKKPRKRVELEGGNESDDEGEAPAVVKKGPPGKGKIVAKLRKG